MVRSRILNCIYIFITIGALFGALLLHSQSNTQTSYIVAGDKRIPVSVAQTQQARQKGLSGTANLPVGTGKLFIFDRPEQYAFWMKDMHYSIDIVWIDESWKIIEVTEAVLPESYPESFSATMPVQYVLEVNAYEATKLNLVSGTQLYFEK